MKRYLLGTLLVVLAVVMVLGGCSKPATTTPTTPATPTTTTPTTPATPTTTTPAKSETPPAAPEPKSGGIWRIIIPVVSPPALGNPWEVPGEFHLLRPILEPILNFDDKANIIPWLATDYKYSPDSLTLTLTLRQGVKFHDGTDFNAAAVKWNMDQYIAAMRSEYMSVSSVEAPDSNTVVVKFTQPDSAFLNHLALSCLTVSPAAYDANGGADGNRWKPVGTGAFKFVSYEQSVKIASEKYDDYWQDGKPYLDGIEIIAIADTTTAIASFLAGEADTLVDRGGSIDPVQLVSKEGEYYITLAPDAILLLMGDSNHADSPFSDIRVRQAMSYAIDTESIVDAMGLGFWRKTNQVADPEGPNFNPDVVGYPYNPQKARALLVEANYADGFDTTIYVIGAFAQLLTAVQAQLDEVGIRAKLETMDFMAYVGQLMLTGWNNGIAGAAVASNMANDIVGNLSKNFSKQGDWWKDSILKPDDLDNRINQAIAEVDLQKRAEIVRDIQKMLIDEYCLGTPVVEIVQKSFSYNKVKDSNLFSPIGGWAWSPERTWFSE